MLRKSGGCARNGFLTAICIWRVCLWVGAWLPGKLEYASKVYGGGAF
jgi:hypothetical protein